MAGFVLGDWQVIPERGLLRRAGEEKHLEPKVMDVLVYLASRQREVVSNDDIARDVWGRAASDEAITRCIRECRRGLGCDHRAPTYIETILRRGYRLIAVVSDNQPASQAAVQSTQSDLPDVHPPTPAYYLPLLVGFVSVGLIIWWMWPANSANSVAVFELECADENTVLCYGITEHLIGTMVRETAGPQIVRVREPVATKSTASCKIEAHVVDSIVFGELRRIGDDINIVIEILDCRNGRHEDLKTFSGVASQAGMLRREIASAVLANWMPNVTAPAADVQQSLPFDLEDRYLQAKYDFSLRSEKSIRSAIELFRDTTRDAPDFGEAYVMLAYAYALLPEYSDVTRSQLYEDAEEAIRKGVALDQRLRGMGQSVQGFIRHKRGQWISARKAHLAAIGADRVFPESHQLYSRLLASVGLLEEALYHAERAREIDPMKAIFISRQAITYFWLDDLDNARIFFERSDSRIEYEAAVHDFAYALFFIRQGDYERAVDQAADGVRKYGGDASWVQPVFAGFHDPTQREAAHRIVEILAQNDLRPTIEISLWVLLGDADRAMDVAKKMKIAGELFEAELMFIPQFKLLRDHPDFPALLDDVGLTEFWTSIGCEWSGERVNCREESVQTIAQTTRID